ncbi:MAG: glycosyltransferase family 39 protein [Deltaproteobacteria bacterium]|nr:glycosyltransferase family 39 protein [Deltaproteobacteria bacterium]
MFTDKFQNKLRSERLIILSLFLLALVIRLIALEHIYLIARDGAKYVYLSQLYLSGSFFEGLSHPYHPLYPALMALVGKVTGNVELTGKLISLTLSSLTVIPLYLIGRFLYDSKVGVMGGLFFVFQPYCVRFSVDVLSDSTFLFFFVLAFYLGLKAGREEKNNKWWSLGAGVSAGLAYLTRPEGIFVIFFLLGWYLWRWIFTRRNAIANTLTVMGILLLAFSILAGPYVFFIKSHTGRWQISMKPSVLKAFQISAPPGKIKRTAISSLPPAQKKEKGSLVFAPAKKKESFQSANLWRRVTYPLLKFIETYHYLLFLFLLIGIWSRNKNEVGNPGGIIFGFLLVYLLCLCYLYHVVSYVSRRHFAPLITISLPLAGIGFWEVQKRFSEWIGRLNNRWGGLLTNYAVIIILLITVLTLIPKALKPQRTKQLPLKEAALWINENGRTPDPVIMSNEPLVAYYAGGKHLYIPGITYKKFIPFLRRKKVDYVVFGERDIKRGAQFLTRLQPDHFRQAPFESRKVLVYEVIR